MSGHRYTELLPPLDKDTHDALQADIRWRGIINPIIVDEEHNIIDGYHRYRIADELGIHCPSITRKGLTEEEKHQEAIDLNLHRRHLTREERREIVAKLNREGSPQREIAERLGVSQMTVSRDLEAVQTNGSAEKKPSPNRRIVGKDGKSYPRKRKSPSSSAKASEANFDIFQRAITMLGIFDTELPEPSKLIGRLSDSQRKDVRRQVEVGLYYLDQLNAMFQIEASNIVTGKTAPASKPRKLLTCQR